MSVRSVPAFHFNHCPSISIAFSVYFFAAVHAAGSSRPPSSRTIIMKGTYVPMSWLTFCQLSPLTVVVHNFTTCGGANEHRKLVALACHHKPNSTQGFGTSCQDNANAFGGFLGTWASAHRKRRAFFKAIVWPVWRMWLHSSLAVSSRLRNSVNFRWSGVLETTSTNFTMPGNPRPLGSTKRKVIGWLSSRWVRRHVTSERLRIETAAALDLKLTTAAKQPYAG